MIAAIRGDGVVHQLNSFEPITVCKLVFNEGVLKEATATMGEGERLFGGFHFVTPDMKGDWPDLEGTLFFAVLDGVGLVHIYGEGKVISPGGKETVLREAVRRPN